MIGENFVGKDVVQNILNKEPNSVVPEERAILEVRKGYLTKEEKERYGIGEFAPKAPKETKSKKK